MDGWIYIPFAFVTLPLTFHIIEQHLVPHVSCKNQSWILQYFIVFSFAISFESGHWISCFWFFPDCFFFSPAEFGLLTCKIHPRFSWNLLELLFFSIQEPWWMKMFVLSAVSLCKTRFPGIQCSPHHNKSPRVLWSATDVLVYEELQLKEKWWVEMQMSLISVLSHANTNFSNRHYLIMHVHFHNYSLFWCCVPILTNGCCLFLMTGHHV